jgi:radical SAM protein with 4Fe4S-binding SPASM domain
VECPYISEVLASDFFAGMQAAVRQQRIPLVGSIELTWRCNLRCRHCYITAAESWPETRSSHQELTTGEFCQLVDEIADQGCLMLLLTGGEPLLREDFLDIYLHAKRRGLLVTVFTNGTLLDKELAASLSEWPPYNVEVTLYGSTRATYERVTGVRGSYERCMRGIDLLLEHDIPLRLKTMVMTLNRHELPAMERFAEGLGLEFRYDPVLNPCLDGSKAPLALRLTPEEAVALDVADPGRLEEWRSFFERFVDVRLDRQSLFHCGAGIHSFHVDPYGRLSLCMMVRNYTYDLRRGSFRDGWHGYVGEVRRMPAGEPYACQECWLAPMCNCCPGWSQVESGADAAPVDYLCQITHLRARALGVAPVESS